MTDPTRPDHSDDPDGLRARLRGADPAAGLAPASPEEHARRLAQVTADDQTVESRSDGTQGRSGLTWLVAAAAIVLIAAGVGFVVIGRDGPGEAAAPSASTAPSTGAEAGPSTPTQEPGTDGSTAAPTPTVTDLTVSSAVAGRCAPPSARVVAQQDVAVDAVVTSVAAGQVTLEPTRFYAGDPTDQVVVQDVSADLQALLSAVDFRQGGRYLVSASDGLVTLCGLSSAWSPDLAAVYDEAFPS